MSILELRKKKFYRFLESFLAIFSIGFLVLTILLAIFSPIIFSICLIVYSLLWLFKFSLNVFYTIFSFKQNRRWQTFDFGIFLPKNTENAALILEKQGTLENLKILTNQNLNSKLNSETNSENLKLEKEEVFKKLQEFAQKYQNQIGWTQKIQEDIQVLKNNLESSENCKFWPNQVFHMPVFAVYNEPSSVLLRSLSKIFQNKYDLEKVIVIVSQEARNGEGLNAEFRREIAAENWLEVSFVEKIEIEKNETEKVEKFCEAKKSGKALEIEKAMKIQEKEVKKMKDFGKFVSENNKINGKSEIIDLIENEIEKKTEIKIELRITKIRNSSSKITEIAENLLEELPKNQAMQKIENESKIQNKVQNKSEIEKILLETGETENQNKIGQKTLKSQKLRVFFCEHPDGLVGEIKGKASNEDWGARIGAKLLENFGVDKELVLVTSLDADSYLKENFFWHLSYRFCASNNRHQAAFQPVHNYNHNFFEIGFWPRLVATQTTFYNLTNLALEDQIATFAIYSVPLTVLEKVDFWVREVIAEDSLIFLKSLVHFGGDFQVIPHFGQMEADSVEHPDYLEEIISQYRQLQRWAWGGVEGFPYLFWQFFGTENGRNIELRIRLKWLYLLFSNHFFWATTPLIFGIGPFLPNFIHGNSFMTTSTSQNLSLFSQYFAWISYIFTFVFGYLTVVFIALKDQNSTNQSNSNFFSSDQTNPKQTNSQNSQKNNSTLKNNPNYTFSNISNNSQNSPKSQLSNSENPNFSNSQTLPNNQENQQNENLNKFQNVENSEIFHNSTNQKPQKPQILKKPKKLNWKQFWAISVQIIISPLIYFLMAIPALDAQVRGLLGNYLGYWVTPKK